MPLNPAMLAKFDQSLETCKDACHDWLLNADGTDLEHVLNIMRALEECHGMPFQGLVVFANYGLILTGRDYNFQESTK